MRGIAIPAQLAVCGFGDFEITRVMHPAVTTVSVDGAENGAASLPNACSNAARRRHRAPRDGDPIPNRRARFYQTVAVDTLLT